MKNNLKNDLNLKRKVNTMSEVIGKVAGKVWTYLDKNESASPSRIAKEIKASEKDIQRAIGWLAREGKIIIKVEGRIEILSLNK